MGLNRFETFALGGAGALVASKLIAGLFSGLWWVGVLLAVGSYLYRKFVGPEIQKIFHG